MERRKLNFNLLRLTWGLCLVLSLGILPQAHSGEVGGKTKREPPKKTEGTAFQAGKKDPIFITSDRMEVDRKKNTITYQGQVVAIQADMTVRSDTLTAYYTADMKRMTETVAEGKVQVTQGDRVATGTKAVFRDQEQTITLTGNPVVRQGNNQVSGSRIIFFIEEGRAVAEGGTERVKATIFPDELKSQEKGETRPGKER